MLASPAGQWMVDILALVLHHDEQAVLVAVEMALAEGVATKTHVLNLLHRLIDGKIIGGPDIHCPAVHVHMHERGYAASADASARTGGQCRTI
jgi:hypothetical protein